MSEYGDFNLNLLGERSEPLLDRLRATQDEACQDAPGWFIPFLDNHVNTVLGPLLTTLESRLDGKLDRDEVDATVTLLNKVHEELSLIRRAQGDSDAARGAFEIQLGELRDENQALRKSLNARDDKIEALNEQVSALVLSQEETTRQWKSELEALLSTFQEAVRREDTSIVVEQQSVSTQQQLQVGGRRDLARATWSDVCANAQEQCHGNSAAQETSATRGVRDPAPTSSARGKRPRTTAANETSVPPGVQLSDPTDSVGNQITAQDPTDNPMTVPPGAQRSDPTDSVESQIPAQDTTDNPMMVPPGDQPVGNQITAQDIVDNPMTEQLSKVLEGSTEAFNNARERKWKIRSVGKNRIYVCQSCSECRKDPKKAFVAGWLASKEKLPPGWGDLKMGPYTWYARKVFKAHLSDMERAGKVVVRPEFLKIPEEK